MQKCLWVRTETLLQQDSPNTGQEKPTSWYPFSVSSFTPLSTQSYAYVINKSYALLKTTKKLIYTCVCFVHVQAMCVHIIKKWDYTFYFSRFTRMTGDCHYKVNEILSHRAKSISMSNHYFLLLISAQLIHCKWAEEKFPFLIIPDFLLSQGESQKIPASSKTVNCSKQHQSKVVKS